MTSHVNNVQDRNIAAVFSVLDTNRDGVVSAEDFEQLGARVCAQFSIPLDGATGRALLEAYEAWWSQLRRDFDGDDDGRVTVEEFHTAYQRGDPKRFFDEQLGRIAKLVAETVDTDKDGFIGEEEYLRLLAVTTVDQQALVAGFRDLDTDGDGRISVAEFQAGVQRLMLSADPNAPGTSMLGRP